MEPSPILCPLRDFTQNPFYLQYSLYIYPPPPHFTATHTWFRSPYLQSIGDFSLDLPQSNRSSDGQSQSKFPLFLSQSARPLIPSIIPIPSCIWFFLTAMDPYYIWLNFMISMGSSVVSYEAGLRKEGYSTTSREKISSKRNLLTLSIKGLALVSFNIEIQQVTMVIMVDIYLKQSLI